MSNNKIVNEKASQLIAEFNQRFFGANDVIVRFIAAWNSERNVILYGPGGYGKSEMAEFFCKWLERNNYVEDNSSYTLSCSESTSVEALFGGINMKILNEYGSIEYLFSNSLFNNKIVVLEEAFDTRADVLASLKDVLQSRQLRNGNQRCNISTRMLIICTNHSPEDFVTNNSIKALLERFLFQYCVQWNNKEVSDAMRYREVAIRSLRKYLNEFDNNESLMVQHDLHVTNEIENGDLGPHQVVNILCDIFAGWNKVHGINVGFVISPRVAVQIISSVLENKDDEGYNLNIASYYQDGKYADYVNKELVNLQVKLEMYKRLSLSRKYFDNLYLEFLENNEDKSSAERFKYWKGRSQEVLKKYPIIDLDGNIHQRSVNKMIQEYNEKLDNYFLVENEFTTEFTETVRATLNSTMLANLTKAVDDLKKSANS